MNADTAPHSTYNYKSYERVEDPEMPGAFDAFLYVPATPPASPSPTKKPRVSPPAFKSPKLETLTSISLPSPTSVPHRPRQAFAVEVETRQSPRLRSQTLKQVKKEQEESTVASPTPRPKKKRKLNRPYADPSLYAHLPQSVSDTIAPNLTLLIVGLNPGVMTASTGFHFSNPTNLFWPLLYSSRIIHEPLKAKDSHLLPDRYSLGITNVVGRPTTEGGELSKDECVAGSLETIEKVRRWKPKAIALTGKGIWESMFRAIHGRSMKKSDNFAFGWQSETITDRDHTDHNDDGQNGKDEWSCRIFVTMGTSGRVAAYTPACKRQVFAELGEWVNAQRGEIQITEEPSNLQSEIEDDHVKREPAVVDVFADTDD